jgi:predicted MFS family arabinose efflux permease
MPFAGLFFFSTKVSLLYFAVSVGGICASVCVPLVVRLLGYYPTFLSGMLAMAMSALLLSTNTLWVFTVGFFCHAFAIALIEVSLSLYVMQRIARQELSRFEPLRMLSLVAALAIGPWLGVYLEARVAHRPLAGRLPRSARCALAAVCGGNRSDAGDHRVFPRARFAQHAHTRQFDDS